MSSTPELVLQVRDLAFTYPGAPEPLFEGVGFTLYAGDRAALVGVNGVGKSTLLALAAGDLPPSAGAVTRAGRVAVLRQEDRPTSRGDGTPDGDVLGRLLAAHASLAPLHEEIRAQERGGLEDPLRYADLMAAFGERGGFALIERIEAEADAIGLGRAVLARPAASLSGGETRLLALLALFLDPAPLVVLDEPTNYLDERALDVLVERVRTHPGALLVVSHDRWFLDRIATDVLELERGALAAYRGDYSTYRATREADRKDRLRRKARLESEIGRLREAERTYKVWGARKEKEKSGAMDKGFIGARAARLQKRAVLAKERLATRADELEATRPFVERRYRVAFDEARAPSGTVLSARDLRVAFGGEAVLDGASLTLAWGERVALVGENGAGKSTLLRLLLGELAPTGGELLWSSAARVGYLPQRAGEGDLPLAAPPGADEDRARLLLGALGVPGEAWGAPLASLSEGQRRKAGLVRLILEAPNVLVLDEPTSHLDLTSVEMLEEALLDFAGTVLLVSHDRYLRERVCGESLVLADGRLARRPIEG